MLVQGFFNIVKWAVLSFNVGLAQVETDNAQCHEYETGKPTNCGNDDPHEVQVDGVH